MVSPKLFFMEDLPNPKDFSSKSSNAIIYAHGRENGSTVQIYRLPTKDLKRAWDKVCGFFKTPTEFDHNLLKKSEEEHVLDPEGCMHRKDQPPWLPDDLQNTVIPAVFYLIKLSAEEDEALRKELATFTEGEHGLFESGSMDEEKDYLFIPWEGDVDGAQLDMIRISKETGLRNAIFVDRQSANDKSVILTYNHIVWDEDDNGKEIIDTEHQRILGVDSGRTAGREARLAWINLNIANMLLTELVDGGEPEFLSFDLLIKKKEAGDEGGKRYNFRGSTKRAAEYPGGEQRGPKAKVPKT